MYRSLDPTAIVATITQLRGRVQERFPGSSLGKAADELLHIGEEAVARSEWISKSHQPLRLSVMFLVASLGVLVVTALAHVNVSFNAENFSEFVQAVDAIVNEIILLSAGVYFLWSLEARIKRTRALKAIHELRSLAHIIDMHQLTKDPESLLIPGMDTESSPKRTMTAFELARYLDYCSEMLSLIGKIAALYVQRFDDPVALTAVDEIEDLTTGLSNKIWQKIMILHEHYEREADRQRNNVAAGQAGTTG
jgi:hypothetical protein